MSIVEITQEGVFDSTIRRQVNDNFTAVSGGSGSILHQATVTLTNAQVTALPSTPVQIIAAPGTGFLIIPVSGVFAPSIGVAYTNIAADCTLQLTSDTGQIWLTPILNSTGESQTQVSDLLQGTVVVSLASASGLSVSLGETTANELDPTLGRMVINVFGNTGDYTGGNMANTLTVSLAYLVLNTTTGVFV